jgi:hypothetical protein
VAYFGYFAKKAKKIKIQKACIPIKNKGNTLP